jgi:hypothetical protein
MIVRRRELLLDVTAVAALGHERDQISAFARAVVGERNRSFFCLKSEETYIRLGEGGGGGGEGQTEEIESITY